MIFKRLIAGTITFLIASSCFAISDTEFEGKLIGNAIFASAWYENCEKDFYYYIRDDDTAEIAFYTGKKENPVVPYMIAGKVVTSISGIGEAWQGAFETCSNMKSITIPASVKSIHKYAFGYPEDGVHPMKDVVINCYAGSAAEQFAKNNRYDYKIIPHEKHSYTMTHKWQTFFDGGYTIYQCEECGHWYKSDTTNKWVMENVTGFKVAATSSCAVKLEWDNIYKHWVPESQVDGYIIYRYNTTTKKYNRIAKIKHTGTTVFTDKNLKAGKTYKYAIRAYVEDNGKEVLSPSYPQLTTSTNPATVSFKVTGGVRKALVQWNKVTGATGYKVYYKTSKNGKWIGLKTTNNKTTRYTKTGLKKGKTYYFTVKAYRTVGGKTYNGKYNTKSVTVK